MLILNAGDCSKRRLSDYRISYIFLLVAKKDMAPKLMFYKL